MTPLKTIAQVPRFVLVRLVRVYQLVISPHFPSTCRFTPSCSEYAVQALTTYGAWRGFVLAVYRMLRCNPWGGEGYDPPRWFGEPALPREGYREEAVVRHRHGEDTIVRHRHGEEG